MIPNHKEVTVVKSGVPLDTLEMAVSMKNMGLLMVLLRDNLYSNKNLAPIREYSTNALDAHIAHFHQPAPVSVITVRMARAAQSIMVAVVNPVPVDSIANLVGLMDVLTVQRENVPR